VKENDFSRNYHTRKGLLSRRESYHNKNLNYLLYLMTKLSYDVNDKEICRRLKVFLMNVPLDLSNDHLNQLKRLKRIVSDNTLPESILPFYRHFIFMQKRNDQVNGEIA